MDPRGLTLMGVELEGDLVLSDMKRLPSLVLADVAITGRLDLSHSRIRGGLNIEGGAVRAQLDAAGLTVDRHVYVYDVDFSFATSEGAQFRGEIIMNGATVGDYLQLYVSVDNVSLADARVGGGNGETDGEAVTIGLPGSTFQSIDLNRARFRSSVHLVGEFRRGLALRALSVRGTLDLASAEVLGPISRGRLTDDNLYIDAAGIAAETLLLPHTAGSGAQADLTDCKIGQLVVPVEREGRTLVGARVDHTVSWTLGTMSLQELDARPEPMSLPSIMKNDGEALLDWLPQGGPQQAFPLSAWRAVADTLESEGREEEARWLRIEAEDRHKRSRSHAVYSRLGRIITKSTIGHGYSPFRALGWVGLLWLTSTILAVAAWRTSDSAFVNSSGVLEPPGLWEFLYALDVTVSPVSSFQADIWMPSSWWLALAFWVLKAASYALFALFIAGITGRAMKSN